MSDALDPQALLEGTTPGPWEVNRLSSVGDVVWGVNGYLHGWRRGERGVTWGDVGGQRLYQGPREGDARLIAAAPDLAAALIEARSELAEWHAECDKVGVPYDPPGLVRHHRGNASFAAEITAQAAEAERDAARTGAAKLREALTEARAIAAAGFATGGTFGDLVNIEGILRAALSPKEPTDGDR